MPLDVVAIADKSLSERDLDFARSKRARICDPQGLDLLEQMEIFMRAARNAIREPDCGKADEQFRFTLDVFMRAWRVFAVLVAAGYPHQDMVEYFDGMLDRMGRLMYRLLVRDLLAGRCTEHEAAEAIKVLQAAADEGRWPNAEADLDEILGPDIPTAA